MAESPSDFLHTLSSLIGLLFKLKYNISGSYDVDSGNKCTREGIVIKVKTMYFILSILAVFFLSACASGTTGSSQQNELAEPYCLALNELISTDTALNENMEYISLDFAKELPIKDSDKKRIEDYLQSKYNVKIYNLTYEELVEEKLHEPSESTLKGILLSIKKQERQSDKNITIEVSKYRSNEGAFTSKITLTYEAGQWKVATHTPTKES